MGNQSSRSKTGDLNNNNNTISQHAVTALTPQPPSSSSTTMVGATRQRRGSDTSGLSGSTHLNIISQTHLHGNKPAAQPSSTNAASVQSSSTLLLPGGASSGAAGGGGGGSQQQQQQRQQLQMTLDDNNAAAQMSRSMHMYPLDNDDGNVNGGQAPPYTRKRSNTLDIMGMRGVTSGIDIPTGTNRKGVLPTVVRWKGGGKNVFIAGSFNNWKAKIPMVKSQNDFMMIIELPEGKHEYKFWVDGQWVHDPTNNATVNQYGSKNNCIEVKKSDFEVFEALEKDSEKAPKKEHNESFQTGSPPDTEYSQEIASKRVYETNSGPPILPPHLRDVILNQNLPVDYEPNLLPEPTHVMLNHMYALSIKDGVMVLSTTHRYRKKYVTTLLYKPIS